MPSHNRRRRRRVEYITKEKIVEVPVIEYKEVTIEVPKIEIREKIIEVPQVEVVEVRKEVIVEVPQIEVVERIIEVPVPQYIEREVPVEKEVVVERDLHRFTPICYNAHQPYEFRIPMVETDYTTKKFEVLVPKFIQVPIPSYLLTNEQKVSMRQLADAVDRIANQPTPSLQDIGEASEWVVDKQKEIKALKDNPQPTKDYFDRMTMRLPTINTGPGTPTSTGQPRMVSAIGARPFTLPSSTKRKR